MARIVVGGRPAAIRVAANAESSGGEKGKRTRKCQGQLVRSSGGSGDGLSLYQVEKKTLKFREKEGGEKPKREALRQKRYEKKKLERCTKGGRNKYQVPKSLSHNKTV